MSDTMATGTVLERPSQDGQAERANEAQDQGQSDGRPSDGQAATEQDNIRKLQSTYDKKLAEQAKTLQAQHQAQMQQTYAQMNAMRAQLNQMQEAAAPDDFARLELKLQRAEERAQQAEAAYYQATQAQQAERAKRDAINEVANRYDVDPKVLDGANDYTELVELAIKAQLRNQERKQQHDDERREANRPDVGGGATSKPSSRWEMEYDEAMKRKDSATMTRLLRERDKRK